MYETSVSEVSLPPGRSMFTGYSRLLRRMSSVKFTVRRVTSVDEVQEVFVPRLVSQGGKPGTLDHAISFQTYKQGFFVGELNEKVISCISAITYSTNYSYLGNYIVDELHRNCGYGSILFNTVIATLLKSCNFSVEKFEEQVSRYERFGYKRGWCNKRFLFKISQGSLKLGKPQLNQSGVSVQEALDTQFSELLKYDTSVHIYECQSLLKRWISAQTAIPM